MSKILPKPEKPFAGKIEILATDSQPAKPQIDYPPAGAPNVVIVMFDDVGFGAPGTFGGPVPTPTLDRIAEEGLRFNQFHTTALCSPTRAALPGWGNTAHTWEQSLRSPMAFPVTTA